MNFANLNSLSMLPVRLRHYQKTSNYRSGLLKVIPPTPSLEENFVQPEDYPNQPDNQQSNKYGDNKVRHASSALFKSYLGGASEDWLSSHSASFFKICTHVGSALCTWSRIATQNEPRQKSDCNDEHARRKCYTNSHKTALNCHSPSPLIRRPMYLAYNSSSSLSRRDTIRSMFCCSSSLGSWL